MGCFWVLFQLIGFDLQNPYGKLKLLVWLVNVSHQACKNIFNASSKNQQILVQIQETRC